MTTRLVLISLFLALPAQGQERDCNKAQMTCAEGTTYDQVTKTCIKVTS
ncbi:hypothetical protein [Neogemmobacter tilapiae]|uniref:Uncharacterized protein n=1 Tax=Neogemmobacter tilapiae TaxID=875041 RepID=A0A918THP9_9RHOB|nr:hypothetical protein [Gemmobacter tilapiae]GHC46552.1 hypothetical protein GCM10007315_05350 [Gemmobacter tilapiae]